MSYRTNRRKKGSVKIVSGLLLLVFFIVGGYIYTDSGFEREAPEIHASKDMFWNRKDPLKIKVSDNVGLKNFELILSDGMQSQTVGQGRLESGIKEHTLLIKYPTGKTLDPKAVNLKLDISIDDSSMWNFFQGNQANKSISIKIDHKRPNVNILSHSYSIVQGGSALVVFQADDENLDRLYIETAKKKFKVLVYKKRGYYASLIAWPFNELEFDAKIVATDMAGNRRVVDIPFYIKNHKYKVSWIQARDKFIDGKITDLISSDPEYVDISDGVDKLVAINETMRLKDENKIHKLSSKISNEILDKWKINKFYPLRNAAKVASFGDERHYYYKTKNNEISQSYHVGYDLASTKMANIKTSNAGTVVYAGDNGIYGNMPMIDHGFGLYSLYGHCSQILVKEGEEVNEGQIIAKTGMSGLALGDHLHFGILVQGIEVRPVEWFDGSWIRKNINNIFKEADKIILGK